MQISFYNTSSPYNMINKSLSNEHTYTGSLKNECSVFKPTVLMELDSAPLFNYAYIPEFGRYYFIEDSVCIRDRLYEITMKCDPLMSFSEDIRNCYGVIEKQGSDYFDYYIDDGSYKFENKIRNNVVSFPNGFNNNSDFILITAGGTI